jgi:hypothetical protein
MKKPGFLLLFIFLIVLAAYPQNKTISGKSQPLRININPEYKRGLPPNLFVSMSFNDDNNNGILEADENAVLQLNIHNDGKGPAQGLVVRVNDNKYDPAFKIEDGVKIPFLNPGKSIEVNIPIAAGRERKTAEHKLEIKVTEHFGYDMDPAFLLLNTFKFQEPELVFSGLEIQDVGEGTAAITEDGQVQPGELVKVKVVVQNIGQNVSKNTRYEVKSSDRNVYIGENTGNLGDIGVGEVKEFWLTLSPNKRVETSGQLPVSLTLENDFNRGEITAMALPLSLNQPPPETEILTVEADVESLAKQVARFEYSSNKISANVGKVINIDQAPPSKTVRPNAVAVLMGIEDYRNFAPAPYAVNDVTTFKDYCKNVLGINQVFSYTDNEISGFFFENTFNPDYGELQKAVVKGQTEVFVFYSGHGFPSKNGENVFLFPADGRLEALEMQGYNLNKFYNNLNALGAKSVTVFIDACFSGVSRTTESYDTENLVSMRGVRIKPKVENPWETNSNFSVFTSSAFEETSLGFDPSETGLFTYYLCAGLQGKADANGDKKITTGELAAYISENVKATSQKIRGLQSPQFNGNPDKVLCTF